MLRKYAGFWFFFLEKRSDYMQNHFSFVLHGKQNKPASCRSSAASGGVFFFSARRLNFTYRSFNFQSAGSNIPGCRVGKDRQQVAVTHWLTSHNRQSRKRQQRQISNQTPPPPSSSSPFLPPPSPLLPHTFLPRPPFLFIVAILAALSSLPCRRDSFPLR